MKVIIPTMGKPHLEDCLLSLKRNGFSDDDVFPVREGKSWTEAVNIGFGVTSTSGDDIVLMDDDIVLEDGWKEALEREIVNKDIPSDIGMIGFPLKYSNNKVQHRGCWWINGTMRHIMGAWPQNDYLKFSFFCPHVTTSLCFLKREWIDKLDGMDETYPGYQYEDVDFSLRLLEAGGRILYAWQGVESVHHETLSKRPLPDFHEKQKANYDELHKRWSGERIAPIFEKFPPVTAHIAARWTQWKWDNNPNTYMGFESFEAALKENYAYAA